MSHHPPLPTPSLSKAGAASLWASRTSYAVSGPTTGALVDGLLREESGQEALLRALAAPLQLVAQELAVARGGSTGNTLEAVALVGVVGLVDSIQLQFGGASQRALLSPWMGDFLSALARTLLQCLLLAAVVLAAWFGWWALSAAGGAAREKKSG